MKSVSERSVHPKHLTRLSDREDFAEYYRHDNVGTSLITLFGAPHSGHCIEDPSTDMGKMGKITRFSSEQITEPRSEGSTSQTQGLPHQLTAQYSSHNSDLVLWREVWVTTGDDQRLSSARYVLPTHCICVLCGSEKRRLFPYTTNADCFHNRDGVCLLRGADWISIYNSH
jgi:hypothetical protein